MAAVATTPMLPEDRRPLWSRMMSRIRSRKQKPTPNFPIDDRPPLRPSPLPLIKAEHAGNLALQGWTTVSFPPKSNDYPWPHPLQKAYEDLFKASQEFFALPPEEKSKWKSRLGTEEGWSMVEGEKEFITLRTLERTPDVLKGPAQKYWNTCGNYMDSTLERVSQSLELDVDEGDRGLRRFGGPCRQMPGKPEERTATMLRLFRYEGDEEKVVAEAHADLGLLSMVVGDVPGLEVWDNPSNSWFPIEKTYHSPAASLLGGRQLQRLTNFRYAAGGHRVVSYGNQRIPSKEASSKPETPKYRYSIVFVFRAHEPVVIDTDNLTTNITGPFRQPMKEKTAGQLYMEIQNSHFNINIDLKTREEQKQKLAAKKAAAREASTSVEASG